MSQQTSCGAIPWRRWRRAAFRSKTAAAELLYGAFLVRHGRRAEARAQLNSARARYRDPLAYRRVEEIDALLAKAKVSPPAS